jgi:hypothetical protein
MGGLPLLQRVSFCLLLRTNLRHVLADFSSGRELCTLASKRLEPSHDDVTKYWIKLEDGIGDQSDWFDCMHCDLSMRSCFIV